MISVSQVSKFAKVEA